MNEVLAIALEGLHAQSQRVAQTGANLANVLTAGYRAGVSVQSPIGASFAAHLNQAALAQDPMRFRLDTRPGTLRQTARPLDLALSSAGWFEVSTPQGPAYTRQGSFQLDAAGRIVTSQGYPLAGTGGEITPGTINPVIGPDGTVRGAGGATLAQIRVVSFDDDAVLEPLGGGLYRSASPANPLGAAEVRMHQGQLENSNVSSASEMTQLVRAMRHFESLQKFAQSYDDMLGHAIRKLGDNP